MRAGYDVPLPDRIRRIFRSQKCHASRAGSALVVVLCLLVLMLGVTLAFFSRAQQAREISMSSASSLKADLLASSVIGIIERDLIQEMTAGSAIDPLASSLSGTGRSVLVPLATSTNTYPSMTPQRVVSGTNAPLNIVKESRAGRPFFTTGDGYRTDAGSGPVRASAVSTTAPSSKGKRLLLDAWKQPRLMTSTEFATFTAPDWIYLDRSGGNPTSFTAATMPQLSNRSPDNSSFVIGRFAYVIYDVGGLLDINVAGNTLAADANGRRGRLHQVSLSNTGTMAVPNFSGFVAWRNGTDATLPEDEGGVFDPKRTFLDTPAGGQAFVSRQDLIRYAEQSGSPLSPTALPYLTTFSRDINAPHFQPTQPATVPADLEASLINPDPLAVRFLDETELSRGADPDVTVPAGTPVMARRFPLSKLALLSESDPDPASLLYYFGLSRLGNGDFQYDKAIGTRIARLSEVRDQGREPNLLEVLQATILTGSLGKHGGDTNTFDDARDEKRYLQVLQIAANLIDQWDADDIPTILRYPSGIAGETVEVYGVENLPYINNICMVGHRPTYDRNRFQLWATFDLWNPHQNALTPPQGISSLRIRAVSGKTQANLRYYLQNGSNPYSPLYNSSHVVYFGYLQDAVTLNQNFNFSFSANPGPLGYSRPVILGSDTGPQTAEEFPGILLVDYPNIPPAIPAKPQRHADVQAILDNLTTEDFGIKAHNSYIATSADGDAPVLELQALVDGNWRTYQVVDGLIAAKTQSSNQTGESISGPFGNNTVYDLASEADRQFSFYQWRLAGSGWGFLKTDPRTIRFGHTTCTNRNLGTTIRGSANAYNGERTEASGENWRFTGGPCLPGGGTDGGYGFANFQYPLKPFDRFLPFGYLTNIPEGSLTLGTNPSRYIDRDGVIRPGDGYLGALPTVAGRFADRPVLLNRPFRSVGELGYVFRDLPWKTLDFFSRQSADLGLLDVFSLDEVDTATPVTAGRVNLNTPHAAVLENILKDSANGITDIESTTGASAGAISSDQAAELAAAIVKESRTAPFRFRGDIVQRLLGPASATTPGIVPAPKWSPIPKTAREAAIRSLSDIGTTRAWNLMIDLVVQTGKFPPSAQNGEQFHVMGSRRYWVHLAIDRITGEILDKQVEAVND